MAVLKLVCLLLSGCLCSATGVERSYCSSRSHFLCSDGEVCINAASVCDGVADCTDHSDEHECSRASVPDNVNNGTDNNRSDALKSPLSYAIPGVIAAVVLLVLVLLTWYYISSGLINKQEADVELANKD